MTTKETLRKNVAKAIMAHAAKSQIDTKPKHALRTLMQLMFNLLGCGDARLMTTIDEQFYTDLTTPARMKDLPTITAMMNAYLAYVRACEPFEDAITEIASEFQGKNGEGLGQFMTPRDLAMLAADLAMADRQSGAEVLRAKALAGKRIRVGDPAGSGTGGLMLALLSNLHHDLPEAMGSVDVVSVDIDPDMARATAVQIIWNCLLHDIPMGEVRVYRANALTEYNTAMEPAIVFHPLKSMQVVGGVQ